MVRTVSIITGFTLAIATGPAMAQAPVARLTLDEAVALAARENPTLRAKAFEVQATRAGEITAGLRPNPTASYVADELGGSAFVEHTLTIGQTIETGGKRQRRLESARAATRVTGHELDDLRRQVLFQVRKSFTDALVGRDGVALAGENLGAVGEIGRSRRYRAERGGVAEIELMVI